MKRLLGWVFPVGGNYLSLLSESRLFVFIEFVGLNHTDAKSADNGLVFCGKNRHGERARDLGVSCAFLGYAAEVFLKVTEFHWFAGGSSCSGDSFAKGDIVDDGEEVLRDS